MATAARSGTTTGMATSSICSSLANRRSSDMCCGGHDIETHQAHQRVDPTEAPAPPTASCSECGYPTQEDFVLCPRCGKEILMACPECHRAVQTDWTRCAYCGADLVGV